MQIPEVSLHRTDFVRFSRASQIGLAGILLLTLTSAVRVDAQTAPGAEEHKAWMNDASDAEEDFRFAVTDKDAKAAAAAMTKIETLMQKTEAHWAAKKASD